MDSVFRHLCDFALVILGMSLGYLVKRKSLQGSCGGIASLVWKGLRLPGAVRCAQKTPGARSAA
ncbi:Protein of uncharacterised function (DUF539) [Raoultella terrigena]|uniref:Protein of uncharacterized function (DUF539) n=1 Tax=Raoultella terrigena TaxID=577 RepID=A0A4U9DE18_RAOTE|nr:Protein of uncharacterised function (DUF539) [Raoultella terrigena]